jgi:hypothetical protein
MKPTFSLGIGLALFAAGAFVGQLAPTSSRAQAPSTPPRADPAVALDLTQETSMTLGYLNALRRGNTAEAIALMENHLDMHIVKLGEVLSALPPTERNPQSLKVIQEFRDYREKNPHPSQNPYINNGLPKAYKLLDSSTK